MSHTFTLSHGDNEITVHSAAAALTAAALWFPGVLVSIVPDDGVDPDLWLSECVEILRMEQSR